jgi:uncharacterized protein (UPF0335 family)
MATSTPAQQIANKTTQDQLRSLIERVERLNEEKKVLGEDINSIFSEAKAQGYDTKAMKRVIAIRKLDPQVAAELDELVDLYKHALGMV